MYLSWPSILSSRYIPGECLTYTDMESFIRVFKEALFVIQKNLKPKLSICPVIDKLWINLSYKEIPQDVKIIHYSYVYKTCWVKEWGSFRKTKYSIVFIKNLKIYIIIDAYNCSENIRVCMEILNNFRVMITFNREKKEKWLGHG